MATFRVRDGREYELISNIDDMELGDIEIIEDEFGLDIRDLELLSLNKAGKVFSLISIRRVEPDASIDDTRRVNAGSLFKALADAGVITGVSNPKPERESMAVTDTASSDSDGGEILSPTSADSEQGTTLSA